MTALLDALAAAAMFALPWIGILLLILASAFYSGCETGAYRLNRVRLRLAAEGGHRGAGLLTRLIRDMPGLICVILIGNNTVVYAATVLATGLWRDAVASDLQAEMLATLTMTPVLFIFAEVLPKNVYNIESERMMYPSARPLWVSDRVFRALGLVAGLKGIGWLWSRIARWREAGTLTAEAFPAQARLRAIMRDSTAEGIVTPYQSELVEKIINLRQVTVGDAMVPRHRVFEVHRDIDAEALRRVASSCRFNRLPVTDRPGGDVVGLVAVLDALQGAAEGEPGTFALADYTKPAVVFSPRMTVTQAIFALQRARTPMGVVRNARGQYSGIVTLKDLVEEIVGELEAW